MLTISGLTFGYAPGQAQLDGIDLEVPRGSILGLLGPNGAGKTTLVSLIAGLRRPRAGRLLIDGRPPAPGRQELALVPQEYAFYTRLSGRENLAFFAGLLGLSGGEARERIDRALAECELTEHQHRPAGRYSGGLKRRLNLAIALLQAPTLLILDEPTAGMDPDARQRLLTTLKALNERGTTIVYTSHLLAEVEALCDSVAVLRGGRIVLSGRMDQLLSREQHQIELRLPDAPPAPLREGAIEQADQWWRFALPEGNRNIASLLTELDRAGCAPLQIRYGQKPLEAVFLEATRGEDTEA